METAPRISVSSALYVFLLKIRYNDPACTAPITTTDQNVAIPTVLKVPNRLKRASVHHHKDCCFAPRVVAIGLHSLRFFDESKFRLKFNIAKLFAEHVYPKLSRTGDRWERLVEHIVGSNLEELAKEYDRQGLTKWKAESQKSSPNCAMEDKDFALLLAVDAVFLVVCLESNKRRRTGLVSTAAGDYFVLGKEAKEGLLALESDIDEFLKWDLNLVENQIPLRLLRKVVELEVEKITDVKSPATEIKEEERKKHCRRFEELIQWAIWISYPFLSYDSERHWGDDLAACCCPCTPAEEMPQEADIFKRFSRDWEAAFKVSFEAENVKYAHILDCTYHASSWQSRLPSPGTHGETKVTDIRATHMPKAGEKIATDRKTKVFYIPPATDLQEAGVKIKGTTSGVASSSLVTINFWTITCSLLCTLTGVRCCLCCCSSCCPSLSSCASRWRATLKLPTVKMYKETSRLLRNFATYEQLMDGSGTIRHYIRTMRSLALRRKDVELLIRSGVIQSQLAGPQDVVQSWRDMDNGLNLAPLDEPWRKLHRNLQEHLKNRLKHWYALPRFWRATSPAR